LKLHFKNIDPIVLHISCWVLFILINLTSFYNRFHFFPDDSSLYLRFILDISIFYFNYALLVPKLLLNKKIFKYLIVSGLSIVLYIYLNEQFLTPDHLKREFLANVRPPYFENDFRGFNRGNRIFKGAQMLVVFLLFAVSASVKLLSEWYKNEKVKTRINTEKINAELSFFKTQLNPHFLFNSLNSIYSLANKKSDSTTDAIITLSELMRYMIYETDKNLVSLQNEIAYIKNYISLQNLRLKDSSGVRFNVYGKLDHNIEPLLLISFIENAFKYGTDYTGKTNINIKINIENDTLKFNVSNYISFKEMNNSNSGLGIQNIKNRLNLLYPNSHTLKIEESENLFSVELLLKLKK
jgi:two-component system, LytTR family, sensor kinase